MPIFSHLLDQLEIGSFSAQQHDGAFLLSDSDLDRAFSVFHIEEALGHPCIPAQAEFVQQYGVKSVIGFGGRLPSGEAFAAVLFSAVHIPPAAANHFRVIALSAYLAFLNSDLAFIEEHLRHRERLEGE
jgi:two-component system NtrC family sensor kinase